MAKIIDNEKGFKVIEVTSEEMLGIGCGNICDRCGEAHSYSGYLVCVLNRWFCSGCYKDWYDQAINYAAKGGADKLVEDNNFNYYKKQLGLE